MVTKAQAAANARTATAIQAQRLGFYANTGSGFDYGALAASQQIALTNAVADYILANPALFDTGAPGFENPYHAAAKSKNAPPEATGGELGQFLGELGNNAVTAGESVAGIGNGVLTAARLSSWLIPLAVVVIVGLWIWNTFGRPPRGPSAVAA